MLLIRQSYTPVLNMALRQCCPYFIIVIFAISVASSSASFSSNEIDRTALLALKDEFIKGGTLTHRNSLNSWNDSHHFCHWEGITCGKQQKRVTILDLHLQKLAGFLSPSIGNLTFLEELYLSENSLNGEIPKHIGRLPRLQVIDLRRNSFEGRIPSEIGNCSNLSGLGLLGNKLTGRIPFEFRSLSKITWILIGQNHLTGEMATCFRNFSSLSILSMDDNNFYGEIQDSLNGLSKLAFLSLLGNNFSGSISPLYNISSLQSLNLRNNHFSGMLPQDIDTAFPKLYFLSLFHNKFAGEIPPSLTNISGLESIQLNSNKFTGRVPDYKLGKLKDLRLFVLADNQLGTGSDSLEDDLKFMDSIINCSKLEHLAVSSNRLSGVLRDTVANFTSTLKTFVMGSNYISGPIPEGLGRLSGLFVLDLSDNQFSGTIPSSLGKVSRISKLLLQDNNLHGELPSSLFNLTNILELNLSGNSLNGGIPSAIGKWKGMEVIDLARNQFTGNLPDLFSQFLNLRKFDMSHNSFTGTFTFLNGKLMALISLDASHNLFSGEIPSTLGELSSLEYLSLAGNSFNGSIPASLGNLRGLTFLDLSSNNLSGKVPKELGSLAFLQNLNLSFNHLEGEVPKMINASAVSVAGNNELCNGNQELHLPSCFRPRKKRNNSTKLIIVISLSVAASFSLLLLFCIYFRCRRKDRKDDEGDDLSEEYQRVTYAELFRATEGFSKANLIGTGSYGDVYQCILDGGESKPVAVKVLNLSTPGATKSFNAECRILTRIRHRNLLRIITSCSSLDHKGNDFKALVFDLMSNGNLDGWLHFSDKEQREARVPLALAKRLEIAIDVGCALDYLHTGCETPIVHCDLKPSNILLDEDMVAHVGDFGLAKLLGVTENFNGSETFSTVIKGSIGYVAPEYGMGATVSTQGDTYSYGILLLELITGKRPTDDKFSDKMSLRNFIQRAIPDHVKEVVDQHLVNELQESITTQRNPKQFELHYHTCLVSLIEVGIACSAESPTDRMNIRSAIKCLKRIKETWHAKPEVMHESPLES